MARASWNSVYGSLQQAVVGALARIGVLPGKHDADLALDETVCERLPELKREGPSTPASQGRSAYEVLHNDEKWRWHEEIDTASRLGKLES